MGAVALLACLIAPPAAADEYARLAAQLAHAARKAGVTRVAVVAPEAIGGADTAGSQVVSERLESRLADQPGLVVVERALLDRVLKEQRLAHSGAVAAEDAPAMGRLMGVQAVVTGSLLEESGQRVELDMRLIGAGDARVLGAAVAQVTPDWERDGEAGNDVGTFDVPPPPRLNMDTKAFWEQPRAASAAGCADWEGRVDRLQAADLPLKARYWAWQLRSGVDLASVTRNPGSEIRALETRAAFYAGVRQGYLGGVQPLSATELQALRSSESTAESLIDACEH